MTDEERRERKAAYDKERYLKAQAEKAKQPPKPNMRNKINRPKNYRKSKKNKSNCGSKFIVINYNGEKGKLDTTNSTIYDEELTNLMKRLDGL
tara:strand:+ start:205 stop:483 length:279 start_codon:yes stop_codon:yes gene_type:complete